MCWHNFDIHSCNLNSFLMHVFQSTTRLRGLLLNYAAALEKKVYNHREKYKPLKSALNHIISHTRMIFFFQECVAFSTRFWGDFFSSKYARIAGKIVICFVNFSISLFNLILFLSFTFFHNIPLSANNRSRSSTLLQIALR